MYLCKIFEMDKQSRFSFCVLSVFAPYKFKIAWFGRYLTIQPVDQLRRQLGVKIPAGAIPGRA